MGEIEIPEQFDALTMAETAQSVLCGREAVGSAQNRDQLLEMYPTVGRLFETVSATSRILHSLYLALGISGVGDLDALKSRSFDTVNLANLSQRLENLYYTNELVDRISQRYIGADYSGIEEVKNNLEEIRQLQTAVGDVLASVRIDDPNLESFATRKRRLSPELNRVYDDLKRQGSSVLSRDVAAEANTMLNGLGAARGHENKMQIAQNLSGMFTPRAEIVVKAVQQLASERHVFAAQRGHTPDVLTHLRIRGKKVFDQCIADFSDAIGVPRDELCFADFSGLYGEVPGLVFQNTAAALRYLQGQLGLSLENVTIIFGMKVEEGVYSKTMPVPRVHGSTGSDLVNSFIIVPWGPETSVNAGQLGALAHEIGHSRHGMSSMQNPVNPPWKQHPESMSTEFIALVYENLATSYDIAYDPAQFAKFARFYIAFLFEQALHDYCPATLEEADALWDEIILSMGLKNVSGLQGWHYNPLYLYFPMYFSFFAAASMELLRTLPQLNEVFRSGGFQAVEHLLKEPFLSRGFGNLETLTGNLEDAMKPGQMSAEVREKALDEIE